MKGGVTRLIRIRSGTPAPKLRFTSHFAFFVSNPHGVGEWNGAWNDKSEEWSLLVARGGKELERSGVDDGTFWMDLISFVQGFSCLDVCIAQRNLNVRSFANFFPVRACPWRSCARVLTIKPAQVNDCTLIVMAIQPSKRGSSHGRSDRKKSYKPADVSLILVRISGGKDGNTRGAVEAVSLCCSERTFLCKRLDVGSEYILFALNLGSSPTAAPEAEAQENKVIIAGKRNIFFIKFFLLLI